MPIISLRDNENNRRKRNTKAKKQIKRKTNKQTNNKKRNTEEEKGDRSYSETVKAKWFCCTFKLGFLQLLCKTSLIFKSNLELALSIILKQVELYQSTYVVVEWIFFKIWDLFSFLICSSIVVLKWRHVLPI